MNNQAPKWVPIVSRRFTPFRIYITALGCREEVKRYLGVGCDSLIITKNELGSYYLFTEDTKQLSKSVQEKVKNNLNFSSELAAECRRACGEMIDVSRDSASEVANQMNVVLKNKLQAYCDSYIRFAKFMAIPVALERTLTASIEAAIEAAVGKDKIKENLGKLMTTPALSDSQKEPLDILRLAVAVKKNGTDARALNDHAEKYRWLSCYNIDEPAYTNTYFSDRLALLVAKDADELSRELAEMEQRLPHDIQIYQQTLKELSLPTQPEKEVELLRELVYLRTFRVEMQSKANYYIQPLFKAIADRLKISLRHACALLPAELSAALDGQPVLAEAGLEERCQNYALRYDANGLLFMVGQTNAATIEEQELGAQKTDTIVELRGTTAYQGVVRGQVRVVITKEEIKEFKTGEILVTTMTTPEFVPAMKKAVAIVTNEGGVLCHAAIIARELKVPCVIGTERATAIFKTGDQILVDATAGIVKKV